jgi:hypothetical protein
LGRTTLRSVIGENSALIRTPWWLSELTNISDANVTYRRPGARVTLKRKNP